LDNLINSLHYLLLEKAEEANKIRETFFVQKIPNYQLDVKELGMLDNLRNKTQQNLLIEKKEKSQNLKKLVYPIDLNLYDNDYSQKLLEGINQNIREVQINIQNSSKELKEQGQTIKNAHNDVNIVDNEMEMANFNINEISSKRKCQIVLMYITTIVLFFAILIILSFKFLRNN